MNWLAQHWYRSDAVSRALCIALLPLSWLYRAVVSLRDAAFRRGLLKATRLPVPVIVVGNISVGGTGKTPLTIALAQQLRQRGCHPGIISRGYGGNAQSPQAVRPDSDPQVTGDEALLLARLSGCPVWIGVERVAAARALLDANPDCDILLSDDGLQHHALARDFEIAVIDAARGFGNGWPLPAGPLREAPARLAGVNAIILNGDGARPPALPTTTVPVFHMHLRGNTFCNLRDAQRLVPASYFGNRNVLAVAAIGNPRRFFDHLRALNIVIQEHAYPDHHAYTPADLAFPAGTTVIMTAKDAVKCEKFAGDDFWVLQVEAEIDQQLIEQIMHDLGKRI